MRNTWLIGLLFLGLASAGCATNEYLIKARQDYVDTHPKRSKEIKECILNSKIMRGMTEEEVILSWGDTLDKNKTVTAFGESEQWVYHKWIGEGTDISNRQYLYFENGILDSWQLTTY